MSRDDALRAIRANIDERGYHLYIVSGGVVPRYAYTIGLSEADAGAEVIFAGGMAYLARDVELIVSEAVRHLKRNGRSLSTSFNVERLGSFALQEVNECWIAPLALGALDYYEGRSIRMLQIVPDEQHCTVDVPDMRRALHDGESSAWQWLWRPWEYSVPADATATTNLDALKGAVVTEAARWEASEWELFSGPGPDVDKADIRVIPIGTLLAHDPTLTPVVNLEVGKALWRDEADLVWHAWELAEKGPE